MARNQELEQLQAFARIDGLWVALLWVASFACLIGGFHHPSSGLRMGWLGFGMFSLVFAALRLKRFRDDIVDGHITVLRAYSYSMLTYLYASLLFAIVQFAYFQFLDGGFLLGQYAQTVTSEEGKEMLKAMGVTAEEVKLVIDSMSGLRPIDIALQFFTTNVFMGICISIPVALVMWRRKRRR